jgi:hypothetical protein
MCLGRLRPGSEVHMLSIERCRELLGSRSELSDEEISKLRNHLYSLADAVFEAAGVGESQPVRIEAEVE